MILYIEWKKIQQYPLYSVVINSRPVKLPYKWLLAEYEEKIYEEKIDELPVSWCSITIFRAGKPTTLVVG
jgi:hypothetical protein